MRSNSQVMGLFRRGATGWKQGPKRRRLCLALAWGTMLAGAPMGPAAASDAFATLSPSLVVFPVPWTLGGGLGIQNWSIGNRTVSGRIRATYSLMTFPVYDPAMTRPVQQAAVADQMLFGTLELGDWIASGLRLVAKAEGYYTQLERSLAATYDPTAQANGLAWVMGPELQLDQADSANFPTRGTRFRMATLLGSPYMGNQSSFLIYRGEVQHYVPWLESGAWVASLKGAATQGDLPWHSKQHAGFVYHLRGYPYRRFMGDQLLVGTLEYRKRLVEGHLLPWLGRWGLAGGLFLDGGRAWESRVGIPFPQDIRPGLGGYVALHQGATNLVRLELGVGTEGPVVGLAMGLPFEW